MRTKLSITLIGLVALMSFPAAAAAGESPGDGFLSPDGTTWCQGTATEVGCVAFPEGDEEGPGRGAVLRSGGKLVLSRPASAGRGWRCFQRHHLHAPLERQGLPDQRRLGRQGPR
ncbi:MAG TPA: hypothetical protein VIJ21_09880 [Solirubrobacterales bacterium]